MEILLKKHRIVSARGRRIHEFPPPDAMPSGMHSATKNPAATGIPTVANVTQPPMLDETGAI
jgi:hypothetical protein